MKQLKLFVSLSFLLFAMGMRTQANDVITLTTNVPVGETLSLSIGTDEEQITIDGASGSFVGYQMIEYVVEQPTITISTSETGKLLSINAPDCMLQAVDLSKAPNLTSCKLDNNELTQLDVSLNTALTTLYCQYNNIAQLDVSTLTALKYLACSYNSLTALDVSQNTDLRELYCFNNKIEELDVTALKKLGKLSCAENYISTLDVSNAGISLTSLFCAGNKLSTLDLSKNSWLTYLGCSENQIEDIDLSKNTDLQIVFLQNNPLKHQIDLTTLTKLEEIYLGNTSQHTIDISKNAKLTTLSCPNNNIENLDITNTPNIRFLYLQDNQIDGSTMSAIIDQLPMMSETRMGQIIVKDAEKEDKNICLVEDVEKAKAKYWIVGQYQNGQYTVFDGDQPSGLSQTQMASTICQFNDRQLTVDGAAAGSEIAVYSIQGKLLSQGKADNNGHFSMPINTETPCVIVKTGQNQTFKLLR